MEELESAAKEYEEYFTLSKAGRTEEQIELISEADLDVPQRLSNVYYRLGLSLVDYTSPSTNNQYLTCRRIQDSQAEQQIEKGVAYLKKCWQLIKRLDEVIENQKVVLNNHLTSAMVQSKLCIGLMKLQKFEEALDLELFCNNAQANQQSPSDKLNQTKCFEFLGRHAEAAELLETIFKALSETPDTNQELESEIILGLTRVYTKLNKTKTAMEVFQRRQNNDFSNELGIFQGLAKANAELNSQIELVATNLSSENLKLKLLQWKTGEITTSID